MSTDFTLPLRFKGSRTYVQGPDIHDAVCDSLERRGYSAIEKVDLVCHRLVSTQLTASFADGSENLSDSTHAIFRFRHENQAHTLALVENSDAVTTRVPYDEEALISAGGLNLEKKEISVSPPASYSNAEIVVALNKHLLQTAFPEAKGKWLFTRLQLGSSFRNRRFETMEVRFQGHSNFRITRSLLLGDGQPLGTLYFSLLAAE